MTQTTVAAQVHQPLDIHSNFASEITLDRVVGVDHLADPNDLGVGEFIHATIVRNPDLGTDLARLRTPNPMNVGERDLDALVGRNVDTRNTRHASFSLKVALPQQPAHGHMSEGPRL